MGGIFANPVRHESIIPDSIEVVSRGLSGSSQMHDTFGDALFGSDTQRQAGKPVDMSMENVVGILGKNVSESSCEPEDIPGEFTGKNLEAEFSQLFIIDAGFFPERTKVKVKASWIDLVCKFKEAIFRAAVIHIADYM